MQENNLNLYYNAIYGTTVGVKRIGMPTIHGTNHLVFIVETVDGAKSVFRFCPQVVAHRNQEISRVLTANNISVPRVKVYDSNGCWFEKYEFIPGSTLQERLTPGVSKRELLPIYESMANHIKKMAEIPVCKFNDVTNKYCSDVAQSNIIKKTGSRPLGALVKYGTMLLNSGSQHICHCDFGPHNIVMNDNNQVSAVLDLDAFSIANVNFSIAIAGLALQRNRLDVSDFYNVCRDFMPRMVCRSRIRFAEKICKTYFSAYTK